MTAPLLVKDVNTGNWPVGTNLYVVRRLRTCTGVVGQLRRIPDGWRWHPLSFGRNPSRKTHQLPLTACRHHVSLSDEVLTWEEWQQRQQDERAAA